jgi:hypothetical protein
MRVYYSTTVLQYITSNTSVLVLVLVLLLVLYYSTYVGVFRMLPVSRAVLLPDTEYLSQVELE